MISPSQFVLTAAGRMPPTGQPARDAGRCAMCGMAHEINDLVLPFAPADSFTDLPSLAAPASRVACVWCIGVWDQDFTQRHAKSVVTADGVFPAAKNDHIAWWLANPPSGPWMMFLSDQKQQHLVWRTPVNAGNDVFQVRFGAKILTIRHTKLQAAVEACREICLGLSANRKGAPPKSPYRSLDREIADFRHAQLRKEVYELVQASPQFDPHLQVLLNLTPGEIWALTALLYAKNPEKPEPSLHA